MCRLRRCSYLSKEDKKRRACYAFQEGCLRVARDLWEGPWLTGSRLWILVWPLTEHSLIPPSPAVKQRSCESRLYRQLCQKKPSTYSKQEKQWKQSEHTGASPFSAIHLQNEFLITTWDSRFSEWMSISEKERHLDNLNFSLLLFCYSEWTDFI